MNFFHLNFVLLIYNYYGITKFDKD